MERFRLVWDILSEFENQKQYCYRKAHFCQVREEPFDLETGVVRLSATLTRGNVCTAKRFKRENVN